MRRKGQTPLRQIRLSITDIITGRFKVHSRKPRMRIWANWCKGCWIDQPFQSLFNNCAERHCVRDAAPFTTPIGWTLAQGCDVPYRRTYRIAC